MAVPDYQSLMLPSLQALADGSERTSAELREMVAKAVDVSSEDQELLLPSGKQTVFTNRVGWAVTYMAKAGLIARPRRGVTVITDRGRALLAEGLSRIDGSVLERFDEFNEFKTTRHDRDVAPPAQSPLIWQAADVGSPSEAIRALVEEVNAAVAAEVLERVLAQPPVFLEHLVLRLLEAMGYGGVEAISEHLGGPGDEGLDGVIRQDALGLDVVYVQAKRYAPERKIGRPDLQAFVGALNGARANRGIFITTSGFTADAKSFVERIQARIVLIDGPTLAKEMVRRNVGVEVRDVHEEKRIDEDFFAESS
jgi:restriction system protein